MHGPTVPFSEEIHAQKYRAPGESFREAMNRVASALSDGDAHYHAFRDILLEMRFMPAGRVQAAMGSTKHVTAYNCYVSGTIEDTFVDGPGSIMGRAAQAAATMRMGGGIGYDFSTLRPRGDLIRKLGSHSSGPIAFMEIYDAVCRATASSGHRRGAQMGVLRVDHPDIEDFIHAKNNENRLTGFNVSVAVTDAFMHAVKTDGDFDLVFGGRAYRTIKARPLWESIMRSTWDWAEPGILFIDTINNQNNLYYCETIAATNPCGEQPLPPYGACLLGSFNLVRYVFERDGARHFAWDEFEDDIPHVVRAMDNVVDRTIYPLGEQRDEAMSKRRMGLGVTGLANAAEALGCPYGSEGFLRFQNEILRILRDLSYSASCDLAAEKGAFPLFDAERYLAGRFVSRLPDWLRRKIAARGIRNSHLTSIAPTGTISLSADNISSGIEPVFAYSFDRTVRTFNGDRVETIEDYAVSKWGVRGKKSSECSVDDHLGALFACVPYIDSAVSKTCNVPPTTPWQDFKDIYLRAWEAGCKGVTTYNTGGKRAGVLVESAPKEDEERAPEAAEAGGACHYDPTTGRRSCDQ